MKDIAQHANVSIGTVSRVLNRHEDVDDNLRERVEAAALKFGYRLSARTRSVVHSRSKIIGLILLNDFGLSAAQSLLLLGVEEYCSNSGYYLLFARHQYSNTATPAHLEIPNVVQTPGLADCIIVAGAIHQNILKALESQGLHYVLLGNHLMDAGGRMSGSNLVQYDDAGGCYQATRYLAQLGHKHIWYIGDASKPWHRNRFKGYSQAIVELELDHHAHTISLSDDEFESGQAAISYILEQNWPMTAILAASDGLAFGAREGLRQHRLDTPKDVSLIGFEHEMGRARASNLTSVSVEMAEVGRQLAKAAIAQIEEREKDGRPVIIPTSLIKRSTCRPLRKEEHMML
ncbi:MAG TPA: LacI family DNA-binding transcriptional regulator [Bryobacteraceae bacterium]|jgi:DNA-binding LacI/PurR family transcriptional regulator|nr:LacI family DNA-binding transcriptional regulator [Bryobacteraceae bacterium]